MKIEIQKAGGGKNNLLTNICFALFGMFISCSILSLSLKIFESAGLWVGLILNLLTASLIFYYLEPGRGLRLSAWSILVTMGTAVIAYVFLISYVSSSLESVL
jgi:hypothetical protein